ncbi:MAG: DNA polymerase I [Chloroflexota bacterium]|nr:DNA polymerase I [Chloroflexota bacterium]
MIEREHTITPTADAMGATETTAETPMPVAPQPRSARQRLMLIDGHAMIHRAFHALPEALTTSTGEVVNATYGFTTMLIKALADEKPDYIAVTFDRSTPTFRHKEYALYKAQRPPLPDSMRPQFGRIRELVQAFGFPIYEKDGFEADDLLGTLSVQATQHNINTIILSGDMDTLQLVDDHVQVLVAKRGLSEVTVYDEAAVKARYGLEPLKLPDFKGLVGDKSDNIPGVPGIGEKTATRLLSDYGSLEGVLAHLDELKPKEQRLLRETSDQALQSKHLATIVRDAPVQLDLPACKIEHIDRERLLALFRVLEFHSLVDRIPGGSGEASAEVEQERAGRRAQERAKRAAEPEDEHVQATDLHLAAPIGVVPIMTPPLPPMQSAGSLSLETVTPPGIAPEAAEEEGVPPDGPAQLSLFDLPEQPVEVVRRLRLPGPSSPPLLLEEDSSGATNTMIVTSEEALRVLFQSLRSHGAFAFDTETTSEDLWHAELVGMSFSMAAGEGYYLPVGHGRTPDGQEAGTQLPLPFVLEQLRPLMEDEAIHKYMHNAKFDMLLLARYGIVVRGLAFDSLIGAYLVDPGRRGMGLKDQAFQRLGHVMTPITQLIGTGSKMITMAQVPIATAAAYAGADADMTLRLVEPIMADLRRHNLLDLYNSIELPLVPVLMQMELHGIALDADFLRGFEETLGQQIKTLEKAIYDSVGHEFNINSTKQLGEILFGELKLPAGKKTKTGYSVSADVIESLQGRHPMVDHLLEYRQLTKLKSTYVDGLLALMDPVTGRVHTSFNQAVASSGRLSSSNPNLQNIPVRTEVGRQIRHAFIADPSYTLLTADYSQFELRILAHITHEPRLVEAFSQDEDIHTITASSLFAIPVPEVTKDQRRLAKTVVYAVLYGQSAFGLAQITGMSNAEASAFIKRYHETFPRIKGYVDGTLNQAYQQGYVNTLFGRKRFLPDLRTLSGNERQALEREAINMPIQGTNADLIKIAMIRIQHTLEERRLKTRMILQVHDELVFEVPVEELERVRRLVKRIMEGVAELDVPIKVEMKVGKNWYEAEPAD